MREDPSLPLPQGTDEGTPLTPVPRQVERTASSARSSEEMVRQAEERASSVAAVVCSVTDGGGGGGKRWVREVTWFL